MKVLVTGSSGFIGFHTSLYLLKKKCVVMGIDNNNNYYDQKLKIKRLDILKKFKNFKFFRIDLSKLNNKNFKKIDDFKPTYIIHLAAQPGVRYSIKYPQKNFDYNIKAFFNIMEISRKLMVKHFIFASSSSVYGNQMKKMSEKLSTDKPISFYASTKKTNEIMAYAYSSIYKLNCTGLRFFTVYGPYGRPDMSPIIFLKSILRRKNIYLNNNGNHSRDYTYVEDVSAAIHKLLNKKSKKTIPYQIFNIGSGKQTKIKEFVKIIEKLTGLKSKIQYTKLQKGDVRDTIASISEIKKNILYNPTKIELGLKKFIKWYKEYYNE